MKKLTCVLAIVIAIMVNYVPAQAEGFYSLRAGDQRLEFYLLPGETFFFLFFAQETGYKWDDYNVLNNMRGFKDFITFDSSLEFGSNPIDEYGTKVPELLFGDYMIMFPKKISTYSYNDEDMYIFSPVSKVKRDNLSGDNETTFYSDQSFRFHHIWMSNSEKSLAGNYLSGRPICRVVLSDIKPNSVCYFQMDTSVIDSERHEYFYHSEKTIFATDRKRGDVDGNGIVDIRDVEISAMSHRAPRQEDNYNKDGISLGAAIVLFRCPDSISDYLINVWIHNPNNPLVRGLGIGELMSKTAYQTGVAKPAGPTIVRNMPFDSKIDGNRMMVSTEGHAVNLMAYLPDGKIWQDTKWVENGKVEFQIPDPKLEYRIESTWIPGKASVQTSAKEDLPNSFALASHPNPFNPSTTISFSLAKAGETTVEVFNVSGQKVATLARGHREAGRHSIVWNANSFSAGIYFCVIRQGSEERKLKMTLIK